MIGWVGFQRPIYTEASQETPPLQKPEEEMGHPRLRGADEARENRDFGWPTENKDCTLTCLVTFKATKDN